MDAPRPDILCIGSVLWDVIGRSPLPMQLGHDQPGEITRLPGGVALNIAMTLARLGMRPALLTAIGRDPEGDELVAACDGMGLATGFVHRPAGLSTDRYMAVEAGGTLVAAIADARSLEAAGEAILAPLADGRLGSADRPWRGAVVLDGNLTEALLAAIAESPLFAAADLRVAPASPGKARRLRPLIRHRRATVYLNLSEAGLLAGRAFADAGAAADALLQAGAPRVAVTDGAGPAVIADAGARVAARPPRVVARRVTGAGDTFMAAHIAAEAAGEAAQAALDRALAAAARYVAGEAPCPEAAR